MAKKILYQESPMFLRLEKRTPRGQGVGGIKHWLTGEDRLFILWSWMEGWTSARTAREVPCSPATIRKIKLEFIFDLDLVFELGVMRQVAPRQFQCQYCCEIRPSRSKSMKHILSHFLGNDWARTAPIGDVEIL